ncbi:hypothetical protein J6590_100424, partial [Homalodisca vitripennis]
KGVMEWKIKRGLCPLSQFKPQDSLLGSWVDELPNTTQCAPQIKQPNLLADHSSNQPVWRFISRPARKLCVVSAKRQKNEVVMYREVKWWQQCETNSLSVGLRSDLYPDLLGNCASFLRKDKKTKSQVCDNRIFKIFTMLMKSRFGGWSFRSQKEILNESIGRGQVVHQIKGEYICARSVGIPCGLPTKPPRGHGGPRLEPFRMTSCLLGVSQASVFTLVMKDRMYMSGDCITGVLTLQHHLHNGLCRNIANCGGERSPGLGEAPASEEGVINIIIFLRAVSTPRRPDFSNPVVVLPKVTVLRQELTQLEIYLPVATIYPGLKLPNETEGPATVRSFRPPPLPNLQSLHPGSSQGILSTPLGSLPEDGLSLDGQQLNRNHPSHDRHGRTGNGAIGPGDPKCRSSLYR